MILVISSIIQINGSEIAVTDLLQYVPENRPNSSISDLYEYFDIDESQIDSPKSSTLTSKYCVFLTLIIIIGFPGGFWTKKRWFWQKFWFRSLTVNAWVLWTSLGRYNKPRSPAETSQLTLIINLTIADLLTLFTAVILLMENFDRVQILNEDFYCKFIQAAPMVANTAAVLIVAYIVKGWILNDHTRINFNLEKSLRSKTENQVYDGCKAIGQAKCDFDNFLLANSLLPIITIYLGCKISWCCQSVKDRKSVGKFQWIEPFFDSDKIMWRWMDKRGDMQKITQNQRWFRQPPSRSAKLRLLWRSKWHFYS